MKTFVGIGSDHETDVFDNVQSILTENNPEVITLESHIYVQNLGESLRGGDQQLKQKNTLKKLKYPRYSKNYETTTKIRRAMEEKAHSGTVPYFERERDRNAFYRKAVA